MDDRELYHVSEYHQRLIEASRSESLYKSLRPSRPSLSDHLLLKFGDSLIAVGQKIKNGSSFARSANPADLSQECA